MRAVVLVGVLLVAIAAGLAACGGGPGPAAAAPASARPLVAVYGDSLTAGMMPLGGWVQARQDLAWTAELWAAGATVVTAAVGGQTTVDAAGLQRQRLRGLPATHVIVATGINDAVRGVPLAEASRALAQLLDAHPHARVILVAPPVWSDETRKHQRAWRDHLAAVAAIRGAAFVDLFELSQQRPAWRCHEDAHPCPAGHREIGALVAAEL